jgi:hypothetical protein
MKLRDFLELVTPPMGVIFTATPAQVGWHNVAHKSLDSAIQHVNKLTFEGSPAYFSVASYDQARYWDEAAQKWRSRTQENARNVKAFFLDLDVDPVDPLKFDSKQDALTQLKAFVRKLDLPRPMIVDSGGGIHAYWPLAHAVPTTEWRPVAEQFKAICVHERFRSDRSLTSDQARVLRAPGGYNTKRSAPVQVLMPTRPVSFTDFATRIHNYAGQNAIASTSKAAAAAPIAGGQASVWGDEGNLGATNDPLNFDRMVFHCAQLQKQVSTRGRDTGEQLWRAGLGLAKFSEPQEKAARAISDGHREFSLPATITKIENWKTGPTNCSHFHQLNPSLCESCPHFQSITSPAQLGRQIAEVPAPVVQVPAPDGTVVTVTVPDLPTGYKRRSDGAITIVSEDKDGKEIYTVVSPYDLYPLAIRSQNGTDANVDERSVWRCHLPLVKGRPMEPRDIDVPLGLLADPRSLSKLLYSKGVVLSGEQPKMTQQYMSAYLQKLAKESGRDKLYERLGWHNGHDAFVLGDRVLYADGTVQPHTASDAIRSVTKGTLKSAGTLQGWKDAMKFYNRPGYEGHRMFIYLALGSVLFHMNDTGNKGVLVAASGDSGRGKTTCLKACSSLWGHPESLMLNGNREGSTTNALYNHLGTVHSLPMLWDDTTEREPDEVRRFVLNVPQGEGKRRMQADGTMVGRLDTWATLVLMSTNADAISALMSTGKDVNPHLMRMVSVEFGLVDTGTNAKIAADQFIRAMGQNYGHAGPIFMQTVIKHYEAIQRGFIKNVEKVDRLLASSNAAAERFWSSTVATAYTGGQLASKLDLLDWPVEQDLQWMIGLVTKQRDSIRESSFSPQELLTTFLNTHQRSTLIISAKSSSNLDNIAQKPFDDLLVRHELDRDVIYIARPAMMEYCATNRTSFRALEWQLEQSGIIVKRNAQKVLGADTIYSKGQTRCWLIDAAKLEGRTQPNPQPAPAANVVPIKGSKTA